MVMQMKYITYAEQWKAEADKLVDAAMKQIPNSSNQKPNFEASKVSKSIETPLEMRAYLAVDQLNNYVELLFKYLKGACDVYTPAHASIDSSSDDSSEAPPPPAQFAATAEAPAAEEDAGAVER